MRMIVLWHKVNKIYSHLQWIINNKLKYNNMIQTLKSWWWHSRHSNRTSTSYLNHPPTPTPATIYWFECIGMFIFVFLQACTKQPTGIHLQITFILMIAIPMCAKISGAHYNPAVTVSNYLCRFNRNKFSCMMMWNYFKGQFYAATFALALGYILNNHFLAGLAVPNEHVSGIRIMFSQLWATALLVFYTQLTANSQTTFASNDGQKYCFIIAFVFVARKTAYVSAFAINPAITMATVVMAIYTCQYLYLHICYLYLIGDFAGAILGTLLYNKLYVPALYAARGRDDYYGQESDNQVMTPFDSAADSNKQQQSECFPSNLSDLRKFSVQASPKKTFSKKQAQIPSLQLITH